MVYTGELDVGTKIVVKRLECGSCRMGSKGMNELEASIWCSFIINIYFNQYKLNTDTEIVWYVKHRDAIKMGTKTKHKSLHA